MDLTELLVGRFLVLNVHLVPLLQHPHCFFLPSDVVFRCKLSNSLRIETDSKDRANVTFTVEMVDVCCVRDLVRLAVDLDLFAALEEHRS